METIEPIAYVPWGYHARRSVESMIAGSTHMSVILETPYNKFGRPPIEEHMTKVTFVRPQLAVARSYSSWTVP